jgi:hypothetical protein
MEHIRGHGLGRDSADAGRGHGGADAAIEEIGAILSFWTFGGATTDVHSVSAGSEEIARLLTAPEPFNKRTVEGDLGLYVNAQSLGGADSAKQNFRKNWGWIYPPCCGTTARSPLRRSSFS